MPKKTPVKKDPAADSRKLPEELQRYIENAKAANSGLSKEQIAHRVHAAQIAAQVMESTGKPLKEISAPQLLIAYFEEQDNREVAANLSQRLSELKGLFDNVKKSAAWGAIRDTADMLSQNIESIKAQAQAIATYYQLLEKELEKPEYEGLSAERLEELAEDPEAAGDPEETKRYAELWQQAQNNARAGMQQQEAEAITLPLLQGLNPNMHTMPNNALMNDLSGAMGRQPINAGAYDMTVSNPKGRRKEITAYTMISFDPGDTGLQFLDNKLSEYERQVSDAIVSLWSEAEKRGVPPIFTVDMIFRAMPGGSDKPSSKQKEAITQTIEKLRKLHVFVDATEEMQKRGRIKENEFARFDDYYLSVKHAEFGVKNGGQTVDAYQLNAEPIILTYCKMTGQLLSVPAKYIAIEKVKTDKASGEPKASGVLIAMTPERQAMTGYLLRRIAVLKRDRKNKTKEQKQSDVILFDTLFSDVGLSDQSRDKAMDNRKFCFQVLDFQKVQGNIKDYIKQQQGRKITGIQIVI